MKGINPKNIPTFFFFRRETGNWKNWIKKKFHEGEKATQEALDLLPRDLSHEKNKKNKKDEITLNLEASFLFLFFFDCHFFDLMPGSCMN